MNTEIFLPFWESRWSIIGRTVHEIWHLRANYTVSEFDRSVTSSRFLARFILNADVWGFKLIWGTIRNLGTGSSGVAVRRCMLGYRECRHNTFLRRSLSGFFDFFNSETQEMFTRIQFLYVKSWLWFFTSSFRKQAAAARAIYPMDF